jgi:hypothetical protein
MGGSSTTGIFGTQGIPSNTSIPGSRVFAVSWTDSKDNLWLFGGMSYTPSGHLNDLWQYNISSNQWTWMSGSNTINQRGIYGTQGIPSNTSIPGSRRQPASWTDKENNLWLFGGAGGFSPTIFLNDLWKYNVSTNGWTWISGSNNVNQVGVYSTISSPSYSPASTPALAPTVISTPGAEVKDPQSPQSITTGADIIVPAVVVPVIGIGAIILGVLLGLRRKKQNKNKNKQIDNPISLLSRTDKRLIPYDSVTLEKEIGAGSYGKGMFCYFCISLC